MQCRSDPRRRSIQSDDANPPAPTGGLFVEPFAEAGEHNTTGDLKGRAMLTLCPGPCLRPFHQSILRRELRMPTITQFTRFKSDKSEEMIRTAKQAKAIFEKHGAEFLRLSRIPHRRMGRRVADRLALPELGSIRQGAGEGGQRSRICEAVRQHVNVCDIDRPQHLRRRRTLTSTAPDGQAPAGSRRRALFARGSDVKGLRRRSWTAPRCASQRAKCR